MILQTNVSLHPFNTFHINANASHFIEINNIEILKKVIAAKYPNEFNTLILGGGSNMLLTQDFNGLILKNNLKGIEVIHENEKYCLLKAAAGEVWHEFVQFAIAKNLGGIENLSLIPGTVGAAPIQNIGAYGVEIKDTFHSCEAINLETGETRSFNNSDCNFGYRESIFKHELKGKYFITSVTFKLNKSPEFKIDYGQIKDELSSKGITELSVKAISDAVCSIRRSKLPDPKEIGNAGSFFKNPVISKVKFNELKLKYSDISSYPAGENVKVAAGWLIEKAGWKGKTFGNYGVHKNQALVLVNYSNATGKEIYDLSSKIIESINDIFGIELEREVNMI